MTQCFQTIYNITNHVSCGLSVWHFQDSLCLHQPNGGTHHLCSQAKQMQPETHFLLKGNSSCCLWNQKKRGIKLVWSITCKTPKFKISSAAQRADGYFGVLTFIENNRCVETRSWLQKKKLIPSKTLRPQTVSPLCRVFSFLNAKIPPQLYLHVAGGYDNGIGNKRLLDCNPNTSRLPANKAAFAASKSGVSEDCPIKGPVLVESALNSCIFKSAAGSRDYKKHIWWLKVSAEVWAWPTGTSGPDLSSDWLPVTSAVSIPCFCSACPQRALPFKGRGLIFSAMFINSKVVF